MGLIKTSLVLAGSYGLIKAAAKAVNDHEEKKQRRATPSRHQPAQTYTFAAETPMGYSPGNQSVHHPSQIQPPDGNEARNHYGKHAGYDGPRDIQPRSTAGNSWDGNPGITQSPPPYTQRLGTDEKALAHKN